MSRTTQWVLGALALLAFLYVMWAPRETREWRGFHSVTTTHYGILDYRTVRVSRVTAVSWNGEAGPIPHFEPETKRTASEDAFLLTLLITLGVLIPLAVVLLKRSSPTLPDRQHLSFPSEAS